MKLFIVGDSMSCEIARLGINKPYHYYFNNINVINKSRIGLNSKKALGILNKNVKNINKDDIMIIQLGIVDCFPRTRDIKDIIIIKLFKILNLNKLVYSIIKFKSENSYEITKNKLIQRVPIKKYKKNLEKIINKVSTKKIIIINIGDVSDNICKKRYGVRDIINNYNKTILEIAKKYNINVVDLNELLKENKSFLVDDGQHFNDECHKILYKLIDIEVKKLGGL